MVNVDENKVGTLVRTRQRQSLSLSMNEEDKEEKGRERDRIKESWVAEVEEQESKRSQTEPATEEVRRSMTWEEMMVDFQRAHRI